MDLGTNTHDILEVTMCDPSLTSIAWYGVMAFLVLFGVQRKGLLFLISLSQINEQFNNDAQIPAML